MARARRGRGEGSIYFDEAKNLWVGSVSITLPGQPRRRPTVYGDSKDSVRQQLDALRAKSGTGSAAPSEQALLTYARWWLENHHASSALNTRHSYRKMIEQHIARIGHIPLAKLTPFQILDWRKDMERAGVGARSRQLASVVLHSMLVHAVGVYRLIPTNPAAGLPGVKVKKKERKPWSVEQAERFLAYTADHRLSGAWALLVYTGMREGEVLGLQVTSVDFAGAQLEVRHNLVEIEGKIEGLFEPKSRRSKRTIPLIPEVVSALRTHRARMLEEGHAGNAYMFPSEAGTPILKSNLFRAFQNLAEAAGLPRITIHDLRHTAGSLLLKAGVSPKVIQEILGHEDIKLTLDTYVHVDQEQKAEALGKLGASLAEARARRGGA
jgi:integrase